MLMLFRSNNVGFNRRGETMPGERCTLESLELMDNGPSGEGFVLAET